MHRARDPVHPARRHSLAGTDNLALALDRPLLAGATEVRRHRVRVARRGGLELHEQRPTGPFVATLQPDAHFGRILAAYGGVFVAGSLAWGMIVDGFRPDRYDVAGAAVCLVGVAVIMYAPRPA